MLKNLLSDKLIRGALQFRGTLVENHGLKVPTYSCQIPFNTSPGVILPRPIAECVWSKLLLVALSERKHVIERYVTSEC